MSDDPAKGDASQVALDAILDHLRGTPSRTWSIIVTFYGDAILPRGGSVWLGALIAFFDSIGISDGVIRTAMSRLASDGWIERSRVGRKSFYRLAEKGRRTFSRASEHIYMARPPRWRGHFDLLVPSGEADRTKARATFEQAGFGAPAPGLWIALADAPTPDEAGAVLRLQVRGEAATNRALAALCWPLDATAQRYRRFLDAFGPLREALATGARLSDLQALTTRVLLIHEYRRVILRDPVLPAEVLPENWPGAAARDLCAEIYGRVLPASERWLDANAIDENGAPLPRSNEVYRRFK